MTADAVTLLLVDESSTIALAQRIGQILTPGDALLLEGEIGAGKSFFARAVIQSLQDVPEDVPSPTFTLVQTYDTEKGEIWHADLYRLSDPDEVAELGLIDALDSAICLIEWPDRLGAQTPATAVRLHFEVVDASDKRKLNISGSEKLLRAAQEGEHV